MQGLRCFIDELSGRVEDAEIWWRVRDDEVEDRATAGRRRPYLVERMEHSN